MLEFAAAILLDVAELHTQRHELLEIAMIAGERLFVSGQCIGERVDLRFQLPGGFIGFPLGKRLIQGDSRGPIVAGIKPDSPPY